MVLLLVFTMASLQRCPGRWSTCWAATAAGTRAGSRNEHNLLAEGLLEPHAVAARLQAADNLSHAEARSSAVLRAATVQASTAMPLEKGVVHGLHCIQAEEVQPEDETQARFVAAVQAAKPTLAMAAVPLSAKPTRGIVIPAGKGLMLGSALVTIRMLRRHLNCSLPVEVWHGSGEVDAASKALLESHDGVSCIDASQMPYPEHHRPVELKGYALKVFALYATSFWEVLLLDSDCLPLVAPAALFALPAFSAAGSMHWPDVFARGRSLVTGVNPWVWRLLGMQPPWAGSEGRALWFQAMESGQVLLDRRRHGHALQWLWLLNSWGPELVYKLMYGDKDTFAMAFALAGVPQEFYQVPEYPRSVLSDIQAPRLEHVGLVHHLPDGRPAFLHRTAGGKLDPLHGTLLRASLIMQPLHPEAAYAVYEGSGEPSNYRIPKDRVEGRSLEACQLLRGSELLYRAACAETSSNSAPGALPQPVMPAEILRDWSGAAVLQQSYDEFDALAQELAAPGQLALTHLDWL